MGYKRMTNEELNEFLSRVFIQLEPELAQQMMSVANELLQYRDKIEQGRFVEIPLTDKDILEDYAHKIFDSWNDITGAIDENCSWYYEALSVIDDIVGMVWGITARQYEAKLRELQGDRE